MTREKAIEIMKQTKEVVNDYHQKAFAMAIKALEQEPKTDVLDKIRAEIPKLTCGDNEYLQALVKVADVIKCIDKYKAEGEDKE